WSCSPLVRIDTRPQHAQVDEPARLRQVAQPCPCHVLTVGAADQQPPPGARPAPCPARPQRPRRRVAWVCCHAGCPLVSPIMRASRLPRSRTSCSSRSLAFPQGQHQTAAPSLLSSTPSASASVSASRVQVAEALPSAWSAYGGRIGAKPNH